MTTLRGSLRGCLCSYRAIGQDSAHAYLLAPVFCGFERLSADPTAMRERPCRPALDRSFKLGSLGQAKTCAIPLVLVFITCQVLVLVPLLLVLENLSTKSKLCESL